MNKARDKVMLAEVTSFLSSCGEFPALKTVDDEFKQAEDRLTKELTRLFLSVENRLISEISITSEERRVFVEEFLRAIYEEFTEIACESG